MNQIFRLFLRRVSNLLFERLMLHSIRLEDSAMKIDLIDTILEIHWTTILHRSGMNFFLRMSENVFSSFQHWSDFTFRPCLLRINRGAGSKPGFGMIHSPMTPLYSKQVLLCCRRLCIKSPVLHCRPPTSVQPFVNFRKGAILLGSTAFDANK